jgi:hypothetical protein
MKLKYSLWRDAVVRHLFANGPMLLPDINGGLRNRDGLRFKQIPTNTQCAMVLRCDKRIRINTTLHKVHEYSVDIDVLKEIGWVPW